MPGGASRCQEEPGAPEGDRRSQGPPGSSWLLLAVPGCSWLPLSPAGYSWLLLAPACSCWLQEKRETGRPGGTRKEDPEGFQEESQHQVT